MKKYLPYIIAFGVILLLVVLVLQGKNKKQHFDDRLSFKRNDKIPYGTYVAFNHLNHIFPDASVSVNRKEPGYWDSLSDYSEKQALIIITPRLLADEFEMNQIIRFIKNGNTVFISTADLSGDAEAILSCDIPDIYDVTYTLSLNNNDDSFYVSLVKPPFTDSRDYICPGKRFESYFTKYNENISTVLGNGLYMTPNFIHMKAGKGDLYLHLAPLVFSNYFLLHKKNINYYNQVMSAIPADTRKIVWDEYYLNKRYIDRSESESRANGKGSMSRLMSNASFNAAVWLLLILLLLFILQEMRRKQRFIPELAKPRNDSLDFVRTIGRLYYEKSDHRNLARKMSAYFREHVRNRYKLSTSMMNEDFIKALQMKTGYPEDKIREIVSFIGMIDIAENISSKTLAGFHKQLEEFYKLG